MEKDALIIYANVAEKLVTWSEKRIGKFIKVYFQAKQAGAENVDSGDDAIDMLVSCLLASGQRRSRGGQLGNKNAQKAKRIENESQTNLLYNNENKNENEIKESEEIRPHTRTIELLPFPGYMNVEEKQQHLWKSIVDCGKGYDEATLKSFAQYYGMPSTKRLGKLVCEECIGWDTRIMLERWVANKK